MADLTNFDFHDFDFDHDSDEDVKVKKPEENAKKTFNRQNKMELNYKVQIDEFLGTSCSSADVNVVLINFSAISGNERGTSGLIPGEMALVAFSIQSGIVDNCAVYINHGKKISDMALDSLNNLLDLPPNRQIEDNYETSIQILNLFRKKYQYGKGKKQLAILFCRKAEYDRVISCLDFLFKMRGEGDKFDYRVIPLELLLDRIARDAKKDHASIRLTETAKILDSGNYRKNRLACTYHSGSTMGLYYCPLRIVNQHAYKIIGALGDTKMSANLRPSVAIENWDCDFEVFKREHQLEDWASITKRVASTPTPTPTSKQNNSKVEDAKRKPDEKPKKEGSMFVLLDSLSSPNSEFYPKAAQNNPTNHPGAYTGCNPNPHMGPFTPGFGSFSPPIHPWAHHPWPTMGSCLYNHSHSFQLQSAPMHFYPMMPYHSLVPMGAPMGQFKSPMDYNQSMMMPYSNNYPPFPFAGLQTQSVPRVNGPAGLNENNSRMEPRPQVRPTNTSSEMENVSSTMSNLRLKSPKPHGSGGP